MSNPSLNIRQAVPSDAEIIAKLGTQLGYPTSQAEAEKRLTVIIKQADQAIYVAEIEGIGGVGWIHIAEMHLLVMEPHAEIVGLVTDESHRSSGIGSALVATAEEWALNRGYNCIRVRSNLVRTRAHTFYEKLGYQCQKTQHAFVKSLSKSRDI
jgi:GNAT superfamily N-acetyltransferase